ncbi:MAG TPA: electron transfer flavoprotein subunit alpha/FixB family protein [Streptosporangiaceae bacterium]|nr:electron transfer flavoprotein subunit alpha/FixB family protein [Streptosporangiaceae bacterium]
MTVLCLLETDAGGGISDASVRTLVVARELAASAGADLAAAWFGPTEAADAGVLAGAGVTSAWAVGPDARYAPLAWARALSGLANGPAAPVSAVLAAATDHGNEVLAHLAAISDLPMAANCVSAAATAPGEFRLVRQRWAGSLLEDAVLEAPLAVLTVAADAVPAEMAGMTAQPDAVRVEAYTPELADGDQLVMAAESAERRSGVSLASARVVVGGGRGVGGAEGFAVLEELAGLLGGVVGVSRVVTSEGWRPHRQQVGQTGTKITPDLYLACGISGAIQHMAGCQGAKTIVAINTDAGAPIVSKADYAVIGDLHTVLPALIEAIKARSER